MQRDAKGWYNKLAYRWTVKPELKEKWVSMLGTTTERVQRDWVASVIVMRPETIPDSVLGTERKLIESKVKRAEEE